MIDLVQSVLSMKLDVYRQTETQNPDTGALKKEWHYHRTLDCHGKGVISNSSGSRAGDKQVLSNRYMNEQNIEIRTMEKLIFSEKITNIRDSQGNVIWSESNYPDETPTVFELIGITPITDPFGKVLAYNSSFKRSENQQIGL